MDEYMSAPRVWGLMCPGFREEITRARRWTRDILSGHPCADDAELIVSELGSNALTHTASGGDFGTFQLTLALSPHAVAISVTDAGGRPAEPHLTDADLYDTHGRGLSIVMALASRLDITGNKHGHTVTAELRAPEAGAAAC
ncbi:ATP-binding protein [Streptomyces sp. RKCA744]|uniref:ATP-binding protein n=1 Tax=Streptomyces sp. RKCA744 TaxID=2959340 RepID=UPI00209DD18B|nr:ATP-binding protein [Streptomyces sp. RKCA744]MCO8306170.1 ATP-binding protein [Streptomyces sp. RKCA744]